MFAPGIAPSASAGRRTGRSRWLAAIAVAAVLPLSACAKVES